MTMRVGLLFGGRSGEHEASIRSAVAIAQGLSTDTNATKYETIPILIHKDGTWEGGDVAQQALASGQPAEQDIREIGELPPAASATQRLPQASMLEGIDIWFRRRRHATAIV